jgi:hypothetical protein
MAPRIDEYIRQRPNPFTRSVDETLDIEKICPRSLWADTPYLRLRVDDFEEISDHRGCRVGGPPVLADDGLRFVAQLDFEDLRHAHQGNLDLPAEGYLALFLRAQPTATAFCEVRYSERLPPTGEPRVGRKLLPELRRSVDEREEDEYEQEGDRLDDHRIFWARHPQGRPWIWDAIDLQLRQSRLDWSPEKWRSAENGGRNVVGIVQDAVRFRLLWQLGSDEALGFDWGDGGRLFVLIDRDDLACRKFDRAHCVVAPFS